MEGYHKPVLVMEVLNYLRVEKGFWYIDATLGDGGITVEILRRGGKVVGVDVDPQAILRAEERLKTSGFGNDDFRLILGNFRELKTLILQTDIKEQDFKGIIFDLGVSSLQLETSERGFSFLRSGPLDMRMDPTLGVTALDLIKVLTRKELYEIFSQMGEEKLARRIADAAYSARQVIKTTGDLANLIRDVYRRSAIKKSRIDPATKVFQALRIIVNDELKSLKEGLLQAREVIKNGRILVISFHSLEDRIVKDTFGRWDDQGLGRILTEQPITVSESEVEKNPRSRSARLRVFEI